MPVILKEGNNELNVNLEPVAAPMATLYGVVVDADTGQALAGVIVTVGGLTTTTDSQGRYSISMTPGSYTVSFEKEGYQTLSY
jgi:uncharacterized membrane protein